VFNEVDGERVNEDCAGPFHEIYHVGGTEEGQPEPQADEELFIDPVDPQNALESVMDILATSFGDGDVAEGDSWEMSRVSPFTSLDYVFENTIPPESIF